MPNKIFSSALFLHKHIAYKQEVFFNLETLTMSLEATLKQISEQDQAAWIQTFTGRKFSPLNPDPEMVAIEDIAHALANLCRFAGHVTEFYSVAQHSVTVSYHCEPANALWGLLHDASEAYLLDLPRPIKNHPSLGHYRLKEEILENVIWFKFGLCDSGFASLPKDVKAADMQVFAAECRDLMSPLHPDFIVGAEPIPERIRPLSPRLAETFFLERFAELTQRGSGHVPQTR